MAKRDYLVSFRTTSDRWEKFKEWAKGRGNSASSELEGFILQCISGGDVITLGDNLIDRPDTAQLIESLRSELDNRLASVEALHDVHAVVDMATDSLRNEMQTLASEVDNLKKH